MKGNDLLTTRYLPYCKYDDNIINNEEQMKIAVNKADVVFSGKVSSDLTLFYNNNTIVFRVIVKRYFKGDLNQSDSEVTVRKRLYDGEGIKCRQVIRPRYTAIFLANKSIDTRNVYLNINPVSITLNNLERINAATKGKFFYTNSIKFYFIIKKQCTSNITIQLQSFF